MAADRLGTVLVGAGPGLVESARRKRRSRIAVGAVIVGGAVVWASLLSGVLGVLLCGVCVAAGWAMRSGGAR